MSSVPALSLPPSIRWRDLVLPKEHGSWSFAAEPLLLGLLVAPSVTGAWLGVALLAGFFARRPLRIAIYDARTERRGAARHVLWGCLGVGGGALAAAVWAGGVHVLLWLVPSATAGAVFLAFDLRHGAREGAAEIAGAMAFALVPLALALAAGWTMVLALALTWTMLGRAVPTVMFVRAYLRAGKGAAPQPWPAVVAAIAAVAGVALFAHVGAAPLAATVPLFVLLARSIFYLVTPRPVVRARTLGFQELVLGLAFVIAAGSAWSVWSNS